MSDGASAPGRSRSVGILELFRQGHQGGRLCAETFGDRQQQPVAWVEATALERLKALAVRAGRAGQLLDAHAPLLTQPPDRPPEEDQVRISVPAVAQENVPNWVKTIVCNAVSTHMP